MQGLQSLKGQTKQCIDNGRKCFLRALTELRSIEFPMEDLRPVQSGFAPGINDRRMGAVPPRKVEPLAAEQAHQLYEKLLTELVDVCRITKVTVLAFVDCCPKYSLSCLAPCAKKSYGKPWTRLRSRAICVHICWFQRYTFCHVEVDIACSMDEFDITQVNSSEAFKM